MTAPDPFADASSDDHGIPALRMRPQRRQHGIDGLGPHAEQRLALVGDMQRIDAEQLRRRTHRFSHRHRQLVDDDADTTLLGHLVQRRRHTATRRILHRDDRARRAVERGANQCVDRRDVGLQVAVERQAVAPRHDRHPVVADRAGHDQNVADAAGRVGNHPIGQGDAGGVEHDAVELSPSHHLRVAGHDRGAGLFAGLANRTLNPNKILAANPSSMITAHVSASTSVAPIIARSLTVPETASRPMSPPGKNTGWITCESVVTTSHRSPIRSAAPSSIAARPIAPASSSRVMPSVSTSLDQRPHRLAAGAVFQRDPFIEHSSHEC